MKGPLDWAQVPGTYLYLHICHIQDEASESELINY